VRFVKDDAGTHGIESRFHVAAPHDLLLELLWNVDNFAELFPQIKSCRVLARTETSVDVAFSFDAMLKEISYVLRRTLEREANEIQWRSLSGDIKYIRGSWSIQPAGPAQLSLATSSS